MNRDILTRLQLVERLCTLSPLFCFWKFFYTIFRYLDFLNLQKGLCFAPPVRHLKGKIILKDFKYYCRSELEPPIFSGSTTLNRGNRIFQFSNTIPRLSCFFFVARVHFKNTRETAQAIKKMPLNRAKKYLKNVMAKKEIVPFRRSVLTSCAFSWVENVIDLLCIFGFCRLKQHLCLSMYLSINLNTVVAYRVSELTRRPGSGFNF